MNVIVVGKAKTGTTAISKRIQKTLGPDTGYVLEPRSAADLLDHPQRQHRHLVVKVLFDHWLDHLDDLITLIEGKEDIAFERCILIRRDVRDEIVSRLLYWIYASAATGAAKPHMVGEWLEVLRAKEADPGGVDIVDLFRRFMEIVNGKSNWKGPLKNIEKVAREYNDFTALMARKSCFVRYERFVAADYRPLETCLGMPLSEDRNLDDLTRTSRTQAAGAWRHVFTPRDVAQLRPIFRDVLVDSGYDDDWTLEPCDQLPSSQFTDYVRRIIKEIYPNDF